MLVSVRKRRIAFANGTQLNIGALSGRVSADVSVLRAICAGIERCSGALDVLTNIGADVTAKPEARLTTGNEGKPSP